MNKLSFAIIPVLLLAQLCQADIYVIVNKENTAVQFSRKDVIDIYMGKTRSFDDGTLIQAIDQRKSSQLREEFYTTLTGKPISFVNAYWAKLFYSGRSRPPIDDYANSQEILDEVISNKGAIAYITEDQFNDNVRIVFKLKTK